MRTALAVALSLLAVATGAQTPTPPPTGAAAAPGAPGATAADTAVLVVYNRPIAVFRTPIGALAPRERALGARRRLEALVEGGRFDSVTTRAVPEGVLVLVGDRRVFTIAPADVDTLDGERLDTVAAGAARRLQLALAAEREERSLPALLWAVGLAVAATIGFLVALRLIRFLRARALARLPASNAALPKVDVGGFTLLSADAARAALGRVVDLAFWVVGLFAAYVWLAFVLTRFAYSQPWGEALGAYLVATVRTLALTAASAVPGLFTVVLILVVTRWVARLIGAFFAAVEAGTVDVPWVHPDTANPTRRIATVLLWLFAIIVAYPYVPGSGSDVFKGVSVFAGLVISLGSSGIVNQAMSGLVLMYSRALKPGDFVRVGEVEGAVTALGMLSTKIRTPKREEITLPNAVVVGTGVRNMSRLAGAEGVILHTRVSSGYGTPWRQVEALLLLAASRTPGLRADPPPFVLKTALSDFYVEYELNAHLGAPELFVQARSALHERIVDAFNEHGVPMLSPHYVGDPAVPAIVPRERWWGAPLARPDPLGGTPEPPLPGT